MHQVLLHLSLIDSFGPAAMKEIMDRMPKTISFAALYDCSVSDWVHLFGFSPVRAQKIVDGLADHALLECELALIEKHAISWMTIADPAYPSLLKEIHIPPTVLYWRGAQLAPSAKRIAIVGSRDATAYGKRAIAALVPSLVAHSVEIVSGGAFGADAMAHEQTLAANGTTIAVLGSGLLRPYPASNKKLFQQIAERGGTVLSIFPLETEPHPGNFPARNRVIAGLSQACVVVQAAERSGARITAQFALEQGRDVFAVPGPFDDLLSAGCHALIAEGAAVVTKPEQLLESLGYVRADVDQEKSQSDVVQASDNVVQTPATRANNLDPMQQNVVEACQQPQHFEEIMAKTNLSAAQLQAILFDLQLDGVLTQNFSGMWECV